MIDEAMEQVKNHNPGEKKVKNIDYVKGANIAGSKK